MIVSSQGIIISREDSEFASQLFYSTRIIFVALQNLSMSLASPSIITLVERKIQHIVPYDVPAPSTQVRPAMSLYRYDLPCD
jgi:hypothetical protein